MAEVQYAFVVWSGTQQKSIIKCSAISGGTATPNEEVTARWRGRSYAATVIRVGEACFVVCVIV